VAVRHFDFPDSAVLSLCGLPGCLSGFLPYLHHYTDVSDICNTKCKEIYTSALI